MIRSWEEVWRKLNKPLDHKVFISKEDEENFKDIITLLWEAAEDSGYNKGKKEGFDEGYKKGFDEGSEKYRDKALRMLDWQSWPKYL